MLLVHGLLCENSKSKVIKRYYLQYDQQKELFLNEYITYQNYLLFYNKYVKNFNLKPIPERRKIFLKSTNQFRIIVDKLISKIIEKDEEMKKEWIFVIMFRDRDQ